MLNPIKKLKQNIAEEVRREQGTRIPILNVKQMSDEKWNRQGIDLAVKHYIDAFNKPPKCAKEAVIWENRKIIKDLEPLYSNSKDPMNKWMLTGLIQVTDEMERELAAGDTDLEKHYKTK